MGIVSNLCSVKHLCSLMLRRRRSTERPWFDLKDYEQPSFSEKSVGRVQETHLKKIIIMKDISARRAEFTERGVRKDPTFRALTPRVLRGSLTSIFFCFVCYFYFYTGAEKVGTVCSLGILCN